MSNNKIDPKVQDVLSLLGLGTILAASIFMPGVGAAAGHFIKEQDQKKWDRRKKSWQKYNQYRLRQVIKRLYQQKTVEVREENGVDVVVLSKKGKRVYLKAKLEDLMVQKQQNWDKKWRLIIYDIPVRKKKAQELFRHMLKKFKFLKLQKSVYLYPYDCENEIEFLRQYYNIGKEVLILTVRGLENEQVYKDYFGL